MQGPCSGLQVVWSISLRFFPKGLRAAEFLALFGLIDVNCFIRNWKLDEVVPAKLYRMYNIDNTVIKM